MPLQRGNPNWTKGKSGNPGGRPKAIVELKKLCQEATPKAIRKVIRLINSEDERVALAAAQTVIERGYGKPTQHVEATVNFFDRLSDVERRTLETALAALAGDARDDASGPAPLQH